MDETEADKIASMAATLIAGQLVAGTSPLDVIPMEAVQLAA